MKAFNALKAMNDPQTKAKLLAAEQDPDPEIARRARELLHEEHAEEEARRTAKEIEAKLLQVKNETCFGVLPMIWFAELPHDVKERYVRGAKGAGHDKFRNATEAYFKDLITQGFRVDGIVVPMMLGEDNWVDFCNGAGGNPLPRTWDKFLKKK